MKSKLKGVCVTVLACSAWWMGCSGSTTNNDTGPVDSGPAAETGAPVDSGGPVDSSVPDAPVDHELGMGNRQVDVRPGKGRKGRRETRRRALRPTRQQRAQGQQQHRANSQHSNHGNHADYTPR